MGCLEAHIIDPSRKPHDSMPASHADWQPQKHLTTFPGQLLSRLLTHTNHFKGQAHQIRGDTVAIQTSLTSLKKTRTGQATRAWSVEELCKHALPAGSICPAMYLTKSRKTYINTCDISGDCDELSQVNKQKQTQMLVVIAFHSRSDCFSFR